MKKKNHSDYLKIVEWSEEDNCYIGTSPGLFEGGVHGKNEEKVFHELCEVVNDVIESMQKNGKVLPKPTSNKNYSGKIALRINPSLHKAISIRALQNGESVNKLISHNLEAII